MKQAASRGGRSASYHARWRRRTLPRSVFPDSASGSYVLPLKKEVHTREELAIGDIAAFELDVAPE